MRLAANALFITNSRNAGGTYDPRFPPRIVVHTIEGSSSERLAATHNYPPHVWYDPETRRLLQTVPFDRAAFALEHPAGTVETNKAGALQVELSGAAQSTPNWPLSWLDNIAEDVIVPMCQYADSVGFPIELGDVPEPGAIPGSASSSAPQRMSAARWTAFRGVCGHRHVPHNEHWDPGAMNLRRVAEHAALVIAGALDNLTDIRATKIDTTEYDMHLCRTNAGLYLLVFSDGSFKIINRDDAMTWDQINAVMVDLARGGLVAKTSDGTPIVQPLGDEGLNMLRER